MKNSDLGQFENLFGTLARYYRIEDPDAATRDAYFSQLLPFSIEIVEEAIERSPTVHPSYFPKVGELLALCHNVVEEIQERKRKEQNADAEETRKKWAKVEKCAHVWRSDAEPEGGLIQAFLVCVYCSAVRPVFSQSVKFQKQRTSDFGQWLEKQAASTPAPSGAELSTQQPGVTQ